jgi:hypothetical protein
MHPVWVMHKYIVPQDISVREAIDKYTNNELTQMEIRAF